MKIIVIAPAGFHLGYLGCYGNLWIDTPSLDALAAESTVFDQHISDCPSAWGASRAWRTGRYSFPSSASKSASVPQDSLDILSLLRASGISSVLITESPSPPQPSDMNSWQKIHAISAEKEGSYQGELWQLAAESMRQLSSNDHGLVWLETNLLMPPWLVEESSCDYFSPDPDEESPEESIDPLLNPTMGLLDVSDETTFRQLQRTYAAAVSRLDRQLGELLEELRQQDLYDSWMIIVTADRGFPLGEHGLVGARRPWLYEELVHIPLIIRLPHGIAGGARIGALTQPVDLMPTLLEAFDLTSLDCHGSSLLPLIRGEQERIRDYACSGLETGGELEYSLRTLDWAFLLPQETGSGGLHPPLRNPQLYVKPDDRWEVNNVLQHHFELAEQLEQTLRAFLKAPTRQAQGLQPEGVESV
jgi:arylsulfatase A-like enzyme